MDFNIRKKIYNEIWKGNKGEIPKENYNGGIHKGKVQRGIFQRKSIKWNFSKGKLKGWIVDRVGFQIYFFSLIRQGGEFTVFVEKELSII